MQSSNGNAQPRSGHRVSSGDVFNDMEQAKDGNAERDYCWSAWKVETTTIGSLVKTKLKRSDSILSQKNHNTDFY